MIAGDSADAGRSFCVRTGPEGFQNAVFFFRRGDNDQASLTGEVKRLESEHAADAAHTGIHRDLFRFEGKSDAALAGDLIEHCSDTAPRGITDNMGIWSRCQNILYCLPERRAVAGDICFYPEIVPGEQDRTAMSADITGDDDAVSGLCEGAARLHTVHDASNGRRSDEDAVNLPFSRDLGIPGYDLHTGFRGSLFHRCGDLLQLSHRKPLLDHERAGHIKRLRPHAGQVVDRPADRQLADISARKKSGRNNKAVCGHGQPPCRDLQHSCVIRCKKRVLKMRAEYLFNQF